MSWKSTVLLQNPELSPMMMANGYHRQSLSLISQPDTKVMIELSKTSATLDLINTKDILKHFRGDRWLHLASFSKKWNTIPSGRVYPHFEEVVNVHGLFCLQWGLNPPPLDLSNWSFMYLVKNRSQNNFVIPPPKIKRKLWKRHGNSSKIITWVKYTDNY